MSWIGIIVVYLGLKLIDKFVEDNIPNLHYKTLFKVIIAYSATAYIIISCGWLRLFKKPASKAFIALLAAYVPAIKLAELKSKKEDSSQIIS